MPNLIRDLGISYDCKLHFDDYIDNIVFKAYQRVNLIFRSFYCHNLKLLKKCYITYVRPLLEYCTPIWQPCKIQNINKLENVQRYFTRRLFPKAAFSYRERLFLLELEGLESRRLKADIKMYYKIIHGLVDLKPKDFFTFAPSCDVTRGHGLRLHKSPFVDLNSFSNRAVNCWNKLSSDIVNASSFATFKFKLDKIDFYEYCVGRE